MFHMKDKVSATFKFVFKGLQIFHEDALAFVSC